MSSPPVGITDQEYESTVSFLCSLERFGILLGLENITQLLERIGNPQEKFPVVHVAGSNGKGSTASFINEIARAAGMKTALYTSPHLNDFRERLRLDGDMVSKQALVTSTEKIRELYDPERTTFFEFTTAVAFDCIAHFHPDLAIVEVGLGGRLDATNTVRPCVTVITDISREHEDYLGVGLKAVAREKAGIIKHKVPLITGASRKDPRSVILQAAAEAEAPVREFGKDFIGRRKGKCGFTYRSQHLLLEDLVLSMPGSHQIKNAALAVAVVEELMAQGYGITETAVRRGIELTKFPGRFELLGREPDVIIDGAHTLEGMRLLKSTITRLYPGVRPLMLLGMLRDKNYEAMVKIIAGIASEVVCVSPQGDRALDPEELAALVRRLGIPARTARPIREGFEILRRKAGTKDVILAAGSLYMIGPVRRASGIAD
ncbi:MAG TPA: folylpolyglutamate synthase/dihydrofolate synthase family protein [Desulfomonilaceae bacterium]|nr:folylpolyglutamate synthase/dihydrofolate synthase family protein [Desulfomonilaceae bacterium]